MSPLLFAVVDAVLMYRLDWTCTHAAYAQVSWWRSCWPM